MNTKMMAKMAMAALLSTNILSHTHSEIQTKVTINAKDKYLATMKTLQEKGIDVLGVDIPNSLIDVNIGDHDKRLIESFKLPLTFHKKTKASIDERYLNPAEIEAFLKETHQKYPEITKLEKIGESLSGHPIWAIKISDNAKTEEVEEPSLLFNGMHHSREIMTPEVTTDIVSYLTHNYATDNKVKNWVDQNEIWVLPMFNVDGNLKVWSGSSMWRKNVRGGYGVDINRNYPTNWNACRGSSGWRNSQTYRGSEAASEPETKVMMSFVERIKPVFNISYHAYSQLVIYPYGCKGQRTANKEVVEKIGQRLGIELQYTAGTAWETLYSVDGSDIDWMYQEHQVIPYVIEVSSRSDGFQPDYSKRQPTVERNRKGWQYLLDRMNGPKISGVTKEYTNIVVEREHGNRMKLIQTYKVNPDGSYFIILNEGKYKLTFKGKKEKVVKYEI